jgi:hypothetical protein
LCACHATAGPFHAFRRVSALAAVLRVAYGVKAQEAHSLTINMEVDVMRELNAAELAFVSGGRNLVCTPYDGNSYGGVSDTGSFGNDLVNMYEGLVFFTSHVIGRVAGAL